jgi:outer membrane receptor protein involved in Fe transport
MFPMKFIKFAAFLPASLAFAVSLSAQQVPQAQTPATDEEIVEMTPFEVSAEADPYAATRAVSATRFSAEIQRVPVSLQVMTEQFMDDIGAVSLEEVFNHATSVTYDQTGSQEASGGNSYNVRGFKAPATRVNGFRGGGLFINRSIVDRMEVARGPQAVLYGQGSAGGTINTITKAPRFKHKGVAKLTLGSYQFQQWNLDLGGPITKKLAYRLVAQYHYNERLNDWHFMEDRVIHPALAWKPSRRVTVNIRYNYLNRDTNRLSAPYNALEYGLQDYYPTPTGVAPADFDAAQRGRYYVRELGREPNLSGPYSRYEYDINTVSGDINIRLTHNITYRGAVQFAGADRVVNDIVGEPNMFRYTARTATPVPGSPLTYSSGLSGRYRHRDLNNDDVEMRHDFLFNLNRDKFGLKVLAGFERSWLDYSRLEVETPNNTATVVPFTNLYAAQLDRLWACRPASTNSVAKMLATGTSPLIGSPTDLSFRLPAWPNGYVAPAGGYQYTASGETLFVPEGDFVRMPNGAPSLEKTISNAYYATMMLDIFRDRVHLLGGIRYDDNDFTVITQTPNPVREFVSSEDFDTGKFSWQGGVTIDLTKSVSLYSTYSTIFAPNNISDKDNKPMGPQTGKGLDIGIKASLFRGKLTGSVVWFHTRREGIPRLTREDSNSPYYYYLSGKEQAQGVEIEVNCQPLPGWRIIANVSFLDGEIVSNAEDPRTEGWDLTGVPDTKVNLWTTYKFSRTFLAGLTVGAGLNHATASPVHGGKWETYWMRTDPYTVYRATVTYPFKLFKYRFTAGARIENIFDKEYIERQWSWGKERTITGFLQVTF